MAWIGCMSICIYWKNKDNHIIMKVRIMNKNVSVIIPSYNRAHVLDRTIPTYIQDITLEVIVVDDGSDDNTKEKVKKLHEKFEAVKYIGFKEHKGLPFAKNVGIKKARGKYIFFGDDDAVLYKGTLRRLRDAIETFPADIAGANGSYASCMQDIRNLDQYIQNQFTQSFDTNCIADFNTGWFNYDYKIETITEGLYIMSPFLIKAELTKDIKFDPSFIVNAAREDMDYLVRQAKKGRKMVYVPDAYEIDLPRTFVRGGGSHSIDQWKNCIYSVRNNNYFINRHYEFLKSKGYISVNKWEAKWNFCIYMIWTGYLWRKLCSACRRLKENVYI